MNLETAREALRTATEVLGSLGVCYWLDCGTLLGLVREGGLLPHDQDVDLSTFDWKRSEEISDAMVAAGFKAYRTFGTPHHGYEQRFIWHNVKLDVFYFYDEGETCWSGSWLNDHLIVSRFDKRTIGRTKKLKGFRVPSQPEALLEARYGDWRTPNTEWEWATDPPCITPDTNPLLVDTTFLVKTFLRYDLALRCVRSIKEIYPSEVLVVDDSNAPESFERELKKLGAKLLRLPYDSGLSAGRNAGIKQIDTTYTVVLDDDAIVTPESKVDNLLRLLTQADIACGAMEQDGKRVEWQGFYRLPKDGGLVLEPHDGTFETHNGIRYARVDFGLNLLAARTVFLKGHPWDEVLKTHEHTDYFLRLKNEGRVVYLPGSVFVHAPTRPAQYRAMRQRKEFRLRFFNKHRLTYHVGFDGHRDDWSAEDQRALDDLKAGRPPRMSRLKLYDTTVNGIRTTLRLTDEAAKKLGLYEDAPAPIPEAPKPEEPKPKRKTTASNKKRTAKNK